MSGTAPKTRAEKVAELEGMLEASIASHDGVLLREREYALSRANQRGSEDELEAAGRGGRPYDEAGEGDSGEDYGAERGGQDGADSSEPGGRGDDPAGENGEAVASGGSGAQGPQKKAGAYPAPAGIPSGSDDDVVARQIREAAENEPDPALREKLWEEYRKYKNL